MFSKLFFEIFHLLYITIERVSIMKKDFVLTIILKEEAKNYSMPKEKAESLLAFIIAKNKEIGNKNEKKDEIIKLIKSSSVVSVERFENQIVIKLS